MRLRHLFRSPSRLRRPSRRATAGLIAAGLAVLVGSVTAATLVAAADEVTVSAVDFEDGTTGTWTQSGDVTLSVIDLPEGGKALSIADRDNDYEGIQSPTGIFEPGVTYTLTMRARLAADTVGSPGVRFVAKPAYTWIGNTAINVDDWTTISGTWTAPEGTDPAEFQIYIGSDNLDAPYTILVDDILITQPGAQPEVVSSVDFEDGTTGTWSQSGGPTLTVIDSEDGKVLEVSNRANDFDGIQSPAGIFEPGVTYTFSLRARLGADGPTSADFRFVIKPSFTWIGNTTISADTWTTVTGQFSVPADADPADYQVYLGSADTGAPYTYLVDDILITAPAGGPGGPEPGTVVIDTDFESDLDGWVPRDGGPGAPTVVLTDVAHGGASAALITDRVNQGAGIGHDVTTLFQAGVIYELTAWLRFGEGQPIDEIWLSLQSTTGASQSFSTLAQFETITNSDWTEVTASFTMPAADSAFIYFETQYLGGDTGNTSDFLVDDILVRVPEPPVVEDLTGIYTTTDFPVGVAIDSRETVGAAAELLTRHFNQITPENHMKPEAWYDADGNFRPHEQAIALMDFAQANDLGLYGHTLVWHSQTPAWFFQDGAGNPLSTSEADQQILRDRLHDHIYGIAKALSNDYGLFGSDTNPLYAFDVVNEVVSDSGEFADGLRRSEWYRILGETYIDLAFQYADEAFNDAYAVAGTDPVTLFINDYNTEQGGKQARLHALVERLIGRGVPVGGVGHQFHASLATPISSFDAALAAFEDLPVVQAVTELDVTTGTPVTEANLIEQGYFFRDAFRVFRAHSDDLFSVTVWGLTDGRSWRSGSGDPLIFDDGFQAKPAYYGAVNGDLPARLRTANVFSGDVALSADAASDLEWSKLPLHPVEDVAEFQLRWAPDHLTAFVAVTDSASSAGDEVTFVLEDQTYTVPRAGTGDVPAIAAERDDGYDIVAHLPLDGAAEGDTLGLDVQVSNDGTTSGWNTPGAVGTLTLVEELSYLEVVQASTTPVIDGAVDATWTSANVVTTGKEIMGTGGAIATVRTLWQDETLYVLAEVADPVVDVSGSDPWIQDSLEIYVDAGNLKNGSYRFDDTQIRINADNVTSFGTGDEQFQANRLESAAVRTETGYTVEAAISLLSYGGLGTFHGLDFQVNDASDGARTAIRNWADPTGIGYQTTARWGVGQLIGPVIENLEAPRILGIPLRGLPLLALPGDWSVDGVTFTYQWQRDGVDIENADNLIYLVKKADVGHELTVVVTARADGYDPVSAVSDPVLAKSWRQLFE